MKRGWNIFWISLMIAVAVATYAMKDSAGRSADRVAALKASIAEEKQQLIMLRAEWGVLDQPSRLQSLVARYNSYLQLQPIDVRQLATLNDLPARAPLGSASEPLNASAAPHVDPLSTGAIDKVAAAPELSQKPRIAKPPVVHRPVSPAPVKTAATKPAAPAAPAALQTGYLE